MKEHECAHKKPKVIAEESMREPHVRAVPAEERERAVKNTDRLEQNLERINKHRGVNELERMVVDDLAHCEDQYDAHDT